VPAAFVLMDELPLTPNGKVDRRALPAPEAKTAQERESQAAPRTPVEELLAGIFEEVLNLGRVGRNDNFFELGGHSLLATKIVSRVREAFGAEIGVRDIFEETTVTGLARRIEVAMKAGEGPEAPPLAKAARTGRPPLSFAQQRLWFLDQLLPNDPLYNMPGAIRLEGRLDIEALERGVNEIVRRHEVLRTRIEMEEGEPVQAIDPWEYRKLEMLDLTGLTRDESAEMAGKVANQEAETGFDLSRGPLLRVKILKLGAEEHVALFTMHHIVSDGWSMGILVREIGELYRAYSVGAEPRLDELPIQYADFAVWQRRWLQGESLEHQLAYWVQHLGGEPPRLELPTDKPRPDGPAQRGAQQSRLLPVTLSDSLKALSLKQSCTLFMTLLAAFKTLLFYLTGQTEITVGTDIANRNRAETEQLIGFFVNQLVLRADLSPALAFEELLRKVREITLGAYAHQDLPFEKLVEAIKPNRDQNRTPLFQVKMVLQNASAEKLDLPGLTISPLKATASPAKFDLLLNLNDLERGLNLSLQYNADLFEDRTPARILDRFQTLLGLIVERPQSKLDELIELLRAEDRRERLESERELETVWLSKLKGVKRKAIGEAKAESK
ncbi:MAG TPA: condensation domain-containing protein, partial [Blastocatellia bacterium]|nr:condensation domain-containing protein [Blastocatellia bacterium]